jgi:hypothetical protein
MTKFKAALAVIEKALTEIRADATDDVIERSVAKIDSELAGIAAIVAEFVNALDDGNGVTNSTEEFTYKFMRALDWEHRGSFYLSAPRAVNGGSDLVLAVMHASLWLGVHTESEESIDPIHLHDDDIDKISHAIEWLTAAKTQALAAKTPQESTDD